MRGATEKQLSYIHEIERITGNKFKGETIVEASNYISENVGLYKYLQQNIGRELRSEMKTLRDLCDWRD